MKACRCCGRTSLAAVVRAGNNLSLMPTGACRGTLFKDKNDAMVELTLPKDANIYAAKYELYLPDKKLLQKKLEQWLAEEGE